MTTVYEIIIDELLSGKRLDVALTTSIESLSRSYLKNHSSNIRVNNKPEKLSYKCREGDKVHIEVEIEDDVDVGPEDIPLDIVYEDDNYIVVNKSYNMVVHPADGNKTGTLVNALLGMNKQLSDCTDEYRRGIVHRLDKETSGLIIVAKNNEAHEYLTECFRERQIEKKYHAIVKGDFKYSTITIENNIGRNPKNRKKMKVLNEGGRHSVTVIEDVRHYGNLTYLDIRLITGRTHQIRVHLSHLGHPVLGDLVYGRKSKHNDDVPMCLTAYKLSFYDRFSDRELTFEIDDPEHMRVILEEKSKI